MKITMKQIVDFYNFYKQSNNIRLPIKTAYKLNKILSETSQEVDFYQQKFSEIISDFSKKDENGMPQYTPDGASVIITEGRQLECQERISELQALEVDVSDVSFSIDELEGIDLSLADIESLMPFIVE